MCGIFGYLATGEIKDNKGLFNLISALAKRSEVRGTDATGFSAFYGKDRGARLSPYLTDKMPLKASQFINLSANFNRMQSNMPSSLIGHTRASTGSANIINNNNHPFYGKKFDLAHNGSITNWQEKAKTHSLDCKSFTDSEVYLRFLEKNGLNEKDNDDFANLFASMDEKIGTNYALSLLNKYTGDVWLLRNEKPTVLFYTDLFGDTVYVWASTESIIRDAVEDNKVQFYKNFHGIEKSGTDTKKHYAYKLSILPDKIGNEEHNCVYYKIPIVEPKHTVHYSGNSSTIKSYEMVYSTYNSKTFTFCSYAQGRPPIDGMTREQYDELDDISEKINSLLGNDCYDTQIYGSAAWCLGGI